MELSGQEIIGLYLTGYTFMIMGTAVIHWYGVTRERVRYSASVNDREKVKIELLAWLSCSLLWWMFWAIFLYHVFVHGSKDIGTLILDWIMNKAQETTNKGDR